MVVGELRERVERMPARVLGNLRVQPARHEPRGDAVASRGQVRVCATARSAKCSSRRDAPHLPHVDLLGDMLGASTPSSVSSAA